MMITIVLIKQYSRLQVQPAVLCVQRTLVELLCGTPVPTPLSTLLIAALLTLRGGPYDLSGLSQAACYRFMELQLSPRLARTPS